MSEYEKVAAWLDGVADCAQSENDGTPGESGLVDVEWAQARNAARLLRAADERERTMRKALQFIAAGP